MMNRADKFCAESLRDFNYSTLRKSYQSPTFSCMKLSAVIAGGTSGPADDLGGGEDLRGQGNRKQRRT